MGWRGRRVTVRPRQSGRGGTRPSTVDSSHACSPHEAISRSRSHRTWWGPSCTRSHIMATASRVSNTCNARAVHTTVEASADSAASVLTSGLQYSIRLSCLTVAAASSSEDSPARSHTSSHNACKKSHETTESAVAGAVVAAYTSENAQRPGVTHMAVSARVSGRLPAATLPPARPPLPLRLATPLPLAEAPRAAAPVVW